MGRCISPLDTLVVTLTLTSYWLNTKCLGILSVEFNKCKQGPEDIYKMGVSLQVCASECTIRGGCVSVTYNTRLHLCILHGQSAVDVSCHSPGYVFSQKTILNTTGSALCTGCADGTSCYILPTGNNVTCQVTECPVPQADLTTLVIGNLRAIGARIQHKCMPGWTAMFSNDSEGIRTCLQSGLWSDGVPLCNITTAQGSLPFSTTPLVTSSVPPQCPIGWATFLSSCYFFEINSMGNFSESLMKCQVMHPQAHLVAISDDTEHDYLNLELNIRTNSELIYIPGIGNSRYFWTGIVFSNDQWEFLHSGAPAGFLRWNPGEPTGGERPCTALVSKAELSYTFGLEDLTCFATMVDFVCELEHEFLP